MCIQLCCNSSVYPKMLLVWNETLNPSFFALPPSPAPWWVNLFFLSWKKWLGFYTHLITYPPPLVLHQEHSPENILGFNIFSQLTFVCSTDVTSLFYLLLCALLLADVRSAGQVIRWGHNAVFPFHDIVRWHHMATLWHKV